MRMDWLSEKPAGLAEREAGKIANPKRGSAEPDGRPPLTNPSGAATIEVARELQQPLEDLARALGQSPTRIVNLALAEYLEWRLRPDRKTSGNTSSYIEMTVREELHVIF